MFLHPAPVDGTNILPPEIASLQSELLQLHLMHEASAQVSRRWEVSAKRSLHMKFEEVASMYEVMLEQERAGKEQKNLKSLLEWSTGRSSEGLVDQIQKISGPLHELPSLVEPGGRLYRLVEDFEEWLHRVQQVQSAREDSLRDGTGLRSVEGLGDSWEADNAALIRRLTSFTRDLDGLVHLSPGSSIACIVDTFKLLLEGVLDELHTMQRIGGDVVTKEKEWVEDRLQGIAREPGLYVVNHSDESVAWRI